MSTEQDIFIWPVIARSNPTPPSDAQAAIEEFGASGILPLLITENGEPDEPILESIICSSMSGGAAFENEMPQTISLTRRLADGTEYNALYQQTIIKNL